ncbi:type II secretion system F family protein [Actinopolyspora mortivallis]|uniref:Secretion system protein n=1 Tax=Actinopolyspora mortivallis TaxID=33906 RepID=A0A2T0GWC2_ACTMO|nr:secretion system protein [Actinopolyspora mortivallis]PRW63408.1 secretion system protein [Actinopolyspora mortivallis]
MAVVLPLLLVTALLCWPMPTPARRLAPQEARPRPVGSLSFRPLAPWAAALSGWALLGPAGAVSVSLLVTVMLRTGERSARFAGTARELSELASGLRMMIGDLRSGAVPESAAAGVAAETRGTVSTVFEGLAVATRLGGPAGPGGHERCPDGLRPVVERLGRCWRLSEHYGVAPVGLLEAVRVDAEQRARLAREVEAKLAGPRATATVLTGLPVLGLLLGQVSGADPLDVLATDPVGQLLLLVGTVLLCAGVLWIRRLTEAAVRS